MIKNGQNGLESNETYMISYTKDRLIVFLCLLLLFPFSSIGQELGRVFIKNYTPKEYKGSTQNWAMTQSDKGFLYVANNSGVLEFDGVNWRLIKVLDDLPVRYLTRANDGTIYVGAVGEIGLLQADKTGALQYVSLIPQLPVAYRKFKDVWRVFAHEDDVFFFARGKLLRWSENTFSNWDIQDASLLNIANGIIYHNEKKLGLQQLIGDSLVMAPQSEQLKNLVIFFMLPYEENSFLLGTAQKGLLVYSPDTVYVLDEELNQELLQQRLYHGCVLGQDRFVIGTRRGGIFIINKKGEIIRQIDQKAGLTNQNVKHCLTDVKGNLWLALNNGLAFLELGSPWQYWNEQNKLLGTVYKVIRHQNTVYAATAQGVFSLEGERVIPVKGTRDATWDLLSFKTSDGEELLLGADTKGFYQIVDNQVVIIRSSPTVFSLYPSRYHENRLLLACKDGIAAVDYVKGKWVDKGQIAGLKEQMRQVVEYDKDQLWALSAYNGLFSIQDAFTEPVVSHYDTAQGLPTLKNLVLTNYQDQYYVLSPNGIYEFDLMSKKFQTTSTLTPIHTQPARLMETDSKGQLWIRSAEYYGTLAKWTPTNGSWQKEDALFKRLPETSVNVILPEKDQLWIGGSEGLFRLTTNWEQAHIKLPTPSIRAIYINEDSLLYGGSGTPSSIVLPYQYNAIRIKFAFPAFENTSNNRFAVKLDGINGEGKWSHWFTESEKEFSNLPAGDFTLLLKAQNTYGEESSILRYQFSVLPPWYRHWFAYLCYMITAVLVIWGIVRWNTKRLKRENEALESLVTERTTQLENALANEQKSRKTLEQANKELSLTQDKLIQSEKMASLGELTAGIANEISNPMNIASAGMETLKLLLQDAHTVLHQYDALTQEEDQQAAEQLLLQIKDLKEEILYQELWPDIYALLVDIEKGINQTFKIALTLSTFTQVDSAEKQMANLHDILDAILLLFNKKILQKELTIIRRYDESLQQILCYPSLINQLFLELINHGIETASVGQKLDLSTGNSSSDVQVNITYPSTIGLQGQTHIEIMEQHDGQYQQMTETGNTSLLLLFPKDDK